METQRRFLLSLITIAQTALQSGSPEISRLEMVSWGLVRLLQGSEATPFTLKETLVVRSPNV